MIIKREQFLEELQLRENIRKIIKLVKKKRQLAEQKDEDRLRMYIRQLIREQDSPDEPAGESGRATGIRVLDEEVLQNVVPIFKKYYGQLDNIEKRESFRSHIINAVENLLNRIESGQTTGETPPPAPSPEPLAEQAVSMSVSPKDDPMYIPVGDEVTEDPEQTAQSEFRAGIDGNLTPDQEVGALRAQIAFNGPDTTIEKAYKTMRGDDAALFREYLITNLKLHFDAMEEEISMPEEPTTPSYEEAAANVEPGLEGGPPPEEAPPGPPEEELPPPGPAAPMM
tara:strand:+ start:346 stop:1194 length:849 start_codon:yes stop_codon:yes gene_type:complete